jgi:hypothetical protein
METTKEVNPHPCIVPCWVSSYSYFCSSSYATSWMLVHVYATSPRKAKWSGPHHNIRVLHFVLFHIVTCYTNSIVSGMQVNTSKLHSITCTLVTTRVILRSLECKLCCFSSWWLYLHPCNHELIYQCRYNHGPFKTDDMDTLHCLAKF